MGAECDILPAVKPAGKLLTTDELADRLGMGVEWIYEQVQKNRLHPFKLSKRDWRWHWETVLKDLEKYR